MSRKKIKETREILDKAGLEGMNDIAVARLARASENTGSPAEQVQALLQAMTGVTVDPAVCEQLGQLAAESEDEREFVNSIFVGPCPRCGHQKTDCCEDVPGIEDPTVGICPECHLLWCTECETFLTREEPVCKNPECFLNQDDDEFEGGPWDDDDER